MLSCYGPPHHHLLLFKCSMLSPQSLPPSSTMSIPGILPSKRVSKVKPVNEYSSIPELQALRSRTLLHLGPTYVYIIVDSFGPSVLIVVFKTNRCPAEVRHQVQNRIAQIDSRIQQLSQANISTIAQGVQHLSLDALPSYNQPGPSNTKPVNYRWTSDASSSNGGGGVSPVSPMSSNDPNTPFGGSIPLSSSPTTPFFTTTKARIVAQPLVSHAVLLYYAFISEHVLMTAHDVRFILSRSIGRTRSKLWI